jgi:PAS domain S-box-containing protein
MSPPAAGDEKELKAAWESLRIAIQETASAAGHDFFQILVRHLAQALGARYSFVAECTDAAKTRVRTLAFWKDKDFLTNVEYSLKGTPCEYVVAGDICSYPERVQKLFPDDRDLVTLEAEGYVGVPLRDGTGAILGHVAVIDDKPLHPQPHQMALLKILAARAGAELERERAHREVQVRNQELAVLLEINRAIGRHLNRGELFGALAQCLRKLVPTERFGIELPIDGGKLQGHILSHFPEAGEPTQPTILPAAGTACDWVIQKQKWYVASSCEDFRERFPVTFEVMSGSGMESLLTLPLVSGGQSLGALFFMTGEKGSYDRLRRDFFDQVASAVAVALDNCLAHEKLRAEGIKALAESEERLRDLFDEAPIAYVNEGLDSKFIRANRTAMKTLGITPDQVEGTYGFSFIPETPDAQRRLKEAFDSIGRGTDTSGVVLELRRKDNGKPLWIQWWSRPDPSGTYTRTMFVDITEKVLMEQEKARLEAQNVYLQEEIKTERNFEEIIGTSTAIKKVLQAIEKVAATDATVLVTGETGTGKELIARAIHNLSGRKDGVLVKVNCAAIPAGLIESELFGHEKGAFTGALARKTGRFELADRATIFLDEVGEIPLELQTKLLRVLQEGEFERLGSTKTVKVSVRVIAATNRDLEKEVREGRFRSDLYYRLKVFPIELPALRERPQDIPLLAAYFVKKYAADMGKKIDSVPGVVMEALKRYDWPGNIRELEHVIERAVILGQGPQLELGDWMPRSAGGAGGGNGKVPTLEETERTHILDVLERVGWKVSGKGGAAELLDLKPTTLEARMKKLGITRKK